MAFPYNALFGVIGVMVLAQAITVKQWGLFVEKYGLFRLFRKKAIFPTLKCSKQPVLHAWEAGYYKTYYEIKMFKSLFLKNLCKRLLTYRPFWPMVYVKGIKE